MRFDTRLVHVGQEADAGTGDVVPAVHVATTFERRVQDPPRYFYARGENPTAEGLEQCLASLEDARFSTVFASGQAAGAAVLALLRPGQRLVACDDVYGGTHALFQTAARYGIGVEHVDLTDRSAVAAALGDDVGLMWIETPTNPLLKVVDLEEVCGLARERGVRVVVDNTFAGPALQQPLRFGADVSLYSTTKSIAGHYDVLGGALVHDDAELDRAFRSHRATIGGVPGALDCFLVHRGLKTLSLRTARQVQNARALVAALRDCEHVGALHYPGLREHPRYETATRQMSAPGSVFSFRYLGDTDRALGRLRLFSVAVSLGGVRSLVERPATMTHAAVPRDVRLRLGVTDDLIRVSAGIEDPADLLDDLLTALRHGGMP
ncbi:cystathionine gamma-synthase [Actinomadura miaoliensis]|uniref:Cystathionine gamma-synthase n=2 Tax=Thermomonosporaceae TaxID=2012 RepID=A0ABP7VQ14_9ACTN